LIFHDKEECRGLRPRLWVRIAAASGLLVTLLFVALSIFPIIDVDSSWRYSLKIAGVVLGANPLGRMVYRAASGREPTPSLDFGGALLRQLSGSIRIISEGLP